MKSLGSLVSISEVLLQSQWSGAQHHFDSGMVVKWSRNQGGQRETAVFGARSSAKLRQLAGGALLCREALCFSTQVEWSNGGSLVVKLEDLRKVLMTTFF